MSKFLKGIQDKLEPYLEKLRPAPHPAVLASRTFVNSLEELLDLSSTVEKTIVGKAEAQAQPCQAPIASECRTCSMYQQYAAKNAQKR